MRNIQVSRNFGYFQAAVGERFRRYQSWFPSLTVTILDIRGAILEPVSYTHLTVLQNMLLKSTLSTLCFMHCTYILFTVRSNYTTVNTDSCQYLSYQRELKKHITKTKKKKIPRALLKKFSWEKIFKIFSIHFYWVRIQRLQAKGCYQRKTFALG